MRIAEKIRDTLKTLRTPPGSHEIYARAPGRMVMLGFGSIGQGTLPIILRHIAISPDNITVLTGDERGRDIAQNAGVHFLVQPLDPSNYRDVLGPLLARGDMLVNLSIDVASLELVTFCQERGALYVDTSVEPWATRYLEPTRTFTERSNFGLRETILAFRKASTSPVTAVVGHGANPGIISHFLKRAIMNVAHDVGHESIIPQTQDQWAKLAHDLGIKVVHIAEYDSQISSEPKKLDRFENTWSIDGLHAEGVTQPSEIGWGTHERHLPPGAKRHDDWRESPIYIEWPGALTYVRTWTPTHESFIGRIVTHSEAVSISEYLTYREGDEVAYRPTVHYAYRPCDAAVLSLEESFGNERELQSEQKVLNEDIVSGMDELGVLLMGHERGAYWYGSQLTIEQARDLAPHQNATGLQVTAGVLGAIVWALENPSRGVVEPEDMDYERVMEVIEPYLGTMTGAYTDWDPLKYRDGLFPEEADMDDPWQFINFRYGE